MATFAVKSGWAGCCGITIVKLHDDKSRLLFLYEVCADCRSDYCITKPGDQLNVLATNLFSAEIR